MTAPQWIVCWLTPEEVRVATRPIIFKRPGQYQTDLIRVLSRLDRKTGRLEILPQIVAQFRIWVLKKGGYEDRYKAILAAVDRAQGRR